MIPVVKKTSKKHVYSNNANKKLEYLFWFHIILFKNVLTEHWTMFWYYRVFIPDENLVFSPEKSLTQVKIFLRIHITLNHITYELVRLEKIKVGLKKCIFLHISCFIYFLQSITPHYVWKYSYNCSCSFWIVH